MAHTKAGGSTSLGRDSQSKRLGIKRFAGQFVRSGNILVRQRGSRYAAGVNVRKTGDDTLMAIQSGYVAFRTRKTRRFDGKLRAKTFVDVTAERAA